MGDEARTVVEEIPGPLDGERIDRVVSLLCGVSRSEARTLVEAGAVHIDGAPVGLRSTRVATGQTVEVALPERAADDALVSDATVPVGVVHADDSVIVVDKPPGLVVHPGAGHDAGTLVHGLLARFPEIAGVGQPNRPGIVHRLDKDTSGLMVVARSPRAYESLTGQLAAREAGRQYVALVWGTPDTARGMVDAPIGRSGRDATRMAVATDGREARTRYEVVRAFTRPVDVALLRCDLETGRTHQIRVHLAAIDHPVVGDATYGGRRQSFPVPRMFLHASRLAFRHPATGDAMCFERPLPTDLEGVMDRLT